MKSLLNYIGKKKDLDIKNYIETYRLGVDTYCEPFAGGFSAGLNLLENGFTGKVILNDLDKEVINFWEELKNNWEELFNTIVKLINQIYDIEEKDEMLHILSLYKKSSNSTDRAAAEYIYRKLLTVRGLTETIRNKKIDSEIDFYLQSKYLENIIIENCSYEEVLTKYDSKNTFFMIDPPYYIQNIASYYRCDSDFFYHKALADRFKEIRGCALLTYNLCDYINNLYKDYDYEVEHSFTPCKSTEIYFKNWRKREWTVS